MSMRTSLPRAAILYVPALNGCASSNENSNDIPGSLPGRFVHLG
jgi:hypothetical protein